MATIDLSRSATEIRKRYFSVRAQQGRAFVDDDHNENERLHGEDERRSRIDIIGPTGSPDSGLLVAGPFIPSSATGKIDFVIKAGTFYLGGLRLEQEADERFQSQSDWLQLLGDPSEGPVAAGATRFDLVYVEAWQQPVSAVEDSELFEVALGGPDTSTRMRLMRRIHVRSNIGTSGCVQAWNSLVAEWASHRQGSLNDDGELVVDTKLVVGFGPGGDPDDLCSPPVASGYLGAENQAIRVQLVDGSHFTWGFDNAAPLYRVHLVQDSSNALKVVSMLTEPKDQAHWPLPGQVVELLPWSAVLSNNEKVAELGGFLATVDAPYDNITKSFTITAAPPAGFGSDWANRSDASVLAPAFFYLRVWNRGSDTLSPAAIPFTRGVPVALGHTGLTMTITGNDARPEDFWIIAARPESPNRVVPWLLESGRAPHGVRRFFAALGVIEWKAGIGTVVDDCRKPFLPLTRIRSCCTYTVGDGEHSTGQFTRIQAAIDALPAEGGEVCVLPGTYTEAVNITRRRNITIHGCGGRSQVNGLRDSTGNGTAPVFTIADGSTNIRIEKLSVEAFGDQPGIFVPDSSRVSYLALEALSVLAGPRSAIEIIEGREVAIVDCHIWMRAVSGPWSGIFSGADDVLIKCNTVRMASDVGRSVVTLAVPAGRGGIQLGGGSERVRVIKNLIRNGMGNGITLGSLRRSGGAQGTGISFWIVNADDPCDPCLPGNVFYPPDKSPGAPTFQSAGYLYDILIQDNRIYDMGLNGIGVIAFFDLKEASQFITVDGLTIVGNDIRHCLRRPLATVPTAMTDSMGYGGISLADARRLVIRNNFIIDNGPSHLEPVCGIFVLHGEAIDISANHILNNGAKMIEPPSQAKNGRRGGINIVYALAPVVMARISPQFELPAQSGAPAVTVHGNVVSQPLGQALCLVALGPVSVLDNQFTSRGMVPKAASPTFIASTVMIFNLGQSNERFQERTGFGYGGIQQPNSTATVTGATVTRPRPNYEDVRFEQHLADGNVMFNDNQCVLDLLAPGVSQSYSSILIVSLDDISFDANQCDCNLLDDFVLCQTVLLGLSVRAIGNRFKEGVANAILSAVTYGLYMNNTSHNQATHCIWALGPTMPGRVVAVPNTILLGSLGAGSAQCEFFYRF